MSKKKNIIALALSTSFIIGGASLSHADEIDNNSEVLNTNKETISKEDSDIPKIEAVSNNNLTNEKSNNGLELSEEISKENVKAVNEKQEIEVTDETKTPDESEKAGDIDKTVINENNEFVGKENGQTSISGDKDIASKEDLDKEKTVDEFNKKARAEKETELNAKIEESKQKIKENQKETDDYVINRANEIADDFKREFQNDLDELSKYDGWFFRLSNISEYTDEDNKKVYFEKSNNFNINDYDKRSKYLRDNNTSGVSEVDYKFDNRENYEGINKELVSSMSDERSNLGLGNIAYAGYKETFFSSNGVVFDFAYKDSEVSDDFRNYILKSNLMNRINDKLSNIYDNNYAKNKKYITDKRDNFDKLSKDYFMLDIELSKIRREYYASITEKNIRSNKVEIIKDPTIWEGSFRWERRSKDGYIKTLIQNDKEIAKRVVHPLVGIKRVGTKTEEIRERRETESSTYDVIERPTTNQAENGKVIQEGSDGLVEKVYDATYDKYSKIIKKDLKDTIVKKKKKDRIVLRYGLKEETKTPATIYDGIKNYDTDEKKIKDFSEDKRYRETDLQPGDTIQNLDITDEKGSDGKRTEKDGFKFITKNPSAGNLNKTEYGYEITIDKKTGQRTYTKIDVTDSGLISVEPGNKPMVGKGDKITAESPTVTYKPNENTDITASSRQRNLNYVASKETLEHINSKDNDSTSFGFEDNYAKENPKPQFFGDSFGITYKVNPWPDENDKLNKIKLNGTYDEKVYAKGQDIKTKIKVDNLDENARERLVGQVYNPVTGSVLKEAEAYIDDEGYVHIKMPKGVINDDGSLNKDSIFNTPEYQGLQNLDVKFFARPRTKAEFKAIADAGEGEWDKGTYTETGAGSKFINHKGKEVEIDLQGIDRYDHYNLIGSFKLQLDDTRYYDQNFLGSDKKDTTTHTSIPIFPGEEFNVKVYLPEDKKDSKTQKSDLDIKDDEKKTVLYGKLDKKFIETYNKDKKDSDKWIIKDDDITKFTIIPPKTAKAGDFMAVPIEYTYTNGSKDVHWFHFVVQGSSNNVPSYQTKVGYQGDVLISDKRIEEDENKNNPISYELADDEYIDSAGNRWTNVKVDPKTGQVTAEVPKNVKINGGEILTVDVKVNYKDKYGIEKEEIVKAEFVARPKYDGKFSYKEVHEIPFETKVEIDKNLKDGEIKVVEEGELGEKTREISQTYENDKLSDQVIGEFEITKKPKDRLIKVGVRPKDATRLEVGIKHETHYKYTDELPLGETKTIKEGKDGKIIYETKVDDEGKLVTNEVEKIDSVDGEVLVGTKKIKNVEIPFNTEYIYDDSLKIGEIKEEQAGKVGNLKITSGYKDKWYENEEKIDPVNRIVRIGGKTNGSHSYTEEIPFKYVIKEDPNLKKGEWVEDVKGIVGGKTTTWTIENSKIVDTKTETKDPVDAVIRVGKGDLNSEKTIEDYDNISFKTKLIFDDSLKAGEEVVVNEGKLGKKKRNVNLTIVDGKVTDTKYGDFEIIENSEDRVIKVGSMTDGKHSHPEKIPFETKVIVNPELKKGEWRYKKEGVLGEKTTTWTIKNSKIVDTKEDVKDPIDAIIEVGSGDFEGDIKHKVVEEKAFDVEIVESPNMVAGTSNIKQKGVKGEVVTEYSQKIKNGQAVGEMTSKEISNKAAIKQIIEVGTKPANNDKDISNEIKVKIEYIYDKNLDKGIVKTGDLIKGKVTTKVVNEYDPKTGEIKTVEKTIVEDAIQKIIVGSRDYTGEFSYDYKEKIPFEVEVREDPTLKKGEKKILQKGQVGEKYYKYSQNIKNGKPIGDKKLLEEKLIKDKVDEIILIGTGENTGELEKKIKREIPFETHVIYDENMESGTSKVEKEGKLGEEEVIIKTKIKDGNGENFEEVKKISDKEDRVVRIGIKPIIKEVETSYNTIYKHNKDLKDGELKTIKEGQNGKVITKIFYNKETGKLETIDEVIEKTDKIVEYGSKTDGELKFRSDIAFNVKVIKDENLDSGKIIVDREGKVGIKETKVTIENSREVNREETIIENSVNKIVRIGTKCDNICPLLPKDPKDPKPEKPKEPKPEKPSDEKPKEPKPEKPKEEKPNKPADPKPEVPKELKPEEPENPKEPKDVDEEKPSDDKPEEPKEEKPITPKEIEDEKIEKIEENLIEDKKLVKDSVISTNVQTGISGAEPFIVSALLSSIGLAFTKKRKED